MRGPIFLAGQAIHVFDEECAYRKRADETAARFLQARQTRARQTRWTQYGVPPSRPSGDSHTSRASPQPRRPIGGGGGLGLRGLAAVGAGVFTAPPTEAGQGF